MTPREAMVAALRGECPDALVPHLELEFQLTDELYGPENQALRDGMLTDITGTARQDKLKRNAEMWIEVAQRFKLNVITGLHWLNMEDQCRSFEYIREVSGDTYMLSAFVDGTFSIPNGTGMVDHVVWLTEKTDEALAQAQAQIDGAVATAKTLIGAGAEVVFMCADYCFNDGPFLSPPMFAKFVTPYLKQIVDGIHAAGGYACKHTDGQIMPILDQMVSTGIDALHSLDPMAGVDIAEVRRLYPKLCLIGNVNCALVQAGTGDEVRESARYCLEHGGVKHGAYAYATSNCIFKGVPLENYETMLAVRDELGHPAAWG
jgi:uroporphyrinogen decarboxylase